MWDCVAKTHYTDIDGNLLWVNHGMCIILAVRGRWAWGGGGAQEMPRLGVSVTVSVTVNC